MTNLVQFNPEALIVTQKDKFSDVEVFKRECEFALQHLKKNDYLMRTASQNQSSLADAISNVAKIGISLNPASAHAYLIPRRIGGKPSVVLDISYRGLCQIAVDSKSVQFIQAKIVREKDQFTPQGIDKEPSHTYNAFAPEEDRGPIVGVYSVAKLMTGDYLTETMTIADINKIKARSESGKKNTGPWISDFEQMALKTVIRRQSKLLPIGDGRMAEAVETLNQHEDTNINTEPFKPITPEQIINITELCEKVTNGKERVLKFISSLNKTIITEFEEFSEVDYLKATEQLALKIGNKS